MGDRFGVKFVAVFGHLLVAFAFVGYSTARNVSELIAARFVFAMGAGSLVTTLSSIMTSMSSFPEECETGTDGNVEGEPDERSSLLDSSARRGSTGSTASLRRHEPARLAGVLGFTSGLGALLAVFGFLRLPTFLEGQFGHRDALRQALRWTLYLAAGLAALEGLFLAAVLPGRGFQPHDGEGAERPARSSIVTKIRKGVLKLAKGFRLATGSGDITLGYAASFASRAQAIVVTAFIPLLVNRYFLDHDLCGSSDLVSPPRESCRQAFVLSSILTGVVQLLSLLSCPIVGLVSSSTRLSNSHPQALALALCFLLGAGGFLGFALLPSEGDPRASISWLYVVALGAAQAAGTVLSLALVTTGRGVVVAQGGRDVSGALSGAYGMSGGFGILIIGSGAGFLFDRYRSAPFIAAAVVDGVVVVGAVALWFRARAD